MTNTLKNAVTTRADYMNNNAVHRDYYAQFVTEGLKNAILFKFGIEALKTHFDSDMFDDGHIELRYWDSVGMPFWTANKMAECGDFLTLSGSVCIAKEAAQQCVEEFAETK